MHTLLQDLRFGARMLLKNPGVTLVAVIALTLGIGANTAIFSVVNAVLLRSLPYEDGERLAIVWENRQSGKGNPQNVINLGNFFDWKEQNNVFSDMAAFFDLNRNLTGDGEPEEVAGQIATTNLFSVLGVKPILGRTFAPDEGKPGQPKIVVIGYDLWQRRFGGDPHIVGRKITINNEPNADHWSLAGGSWLACGKGFDDQEGPGNLVTVASLKRTARASGAICSRCGATKARGNTGPGAE